MTTKESTTLAQVGLTDRQQAVYLALLEIGMGSAAQIAHNAGLERTSIYAVLDSLTSLGLIGEQMVGKKRRFVAYNPNRLRNLLKERQRLLQEMLPDLQALWTATDVRPRVRYYEGVTGMRTVLEDTLTSPAKELLGILSAADLFNTVGAQWMERYTQRRCTSTAIRWRSCQPARRTLE